MDAPAAVPTGPVPPRPEPTQRIHAATQRVRAFDSRRPLVWDLALTLLVALPGVLQVRDGGSWTGVGTPSPQEGIPAAMPVLVLAGLVVPLVWRRRRPFAVLCAVQTAMLVHDMYGMLLSSVVAIGVALYGVALRLPLSRLAWAAGVIGAEIAVKWIRQPPASFAADTVPTLAVIAAIVATAIAMRTRRAYVASLEERAHRLEIERDQKARLAAAAERARIAREMHDIVAHNLAVIVGLADGGAYAAQRDPRRSSQALRAISDTGRHALGELRRLLGVLREDAQHAALTPQPGLADLDPLLTRVRAAGLPVRHTVTGAVGTLSEGRQLAVYRIIQEALTNALKHAGPAASATVRLTHAPSGALDLAVTNTGAHPPPAPSPDGQGLAGMQERSALYDGTLAAGPTPGGWEVRAHFPAAGPDGGPPGTTSGRGAEAVGVEAAGTEAPDVEAVGTEAPDVETVRIEAVGERPAVPAVRPVPPAGGGPV